MKFIVLPSTELQKSIFNDVDILFFFSFPQYIGKTGKVKGFAPNGDAIVVFGSKKYRLFPRVLKKVSLRFY